MGAGAANDPAAPAPASAPAAPAPASAPAAPAPADYPDPAPPAPAGSEALGSAFAQTTAVRPLGDGRYACEFDGGWATAAGINGGILMATIIRALQAELGTERSPRSLQVQFMRPPAAGPAEVEIETIRAGRRATNARVRVTQQGKLMVEGLATAFTNDLDVVGTWAPMPPDDVPAATELEPHEVDPRHPPIGNHVAFRPCIGPLPFTGTPLKPGEPARTGGWLELRDPSPIEPALVAFFVDAWWPAALGPVTELSMNPTVELSLHFRTALPPAGLPHGPLLLEAHTEASIEGLVDEHARVFTADGTLLADAVQLAITRRMPTA